MSKISVLGGATSCDIKKNRSAIATMEYSPSGYLCGIRLIAVTAGGRN